MKDYKEEATNGEEYYIPSKNRNIVNQDPEVTSEKDMDEQVHSETGDVTREDQEIDGDDKTHSENNKPSIDYDEEEDIDDLLHIDNDDEQDIY